MDAIYERDYDVVLIDLPVGVKALTKRCEDDYCTVVLNSRHTWEQNRKSFEHEYGSHVNGDDYELNDADAIEAKAHKIGGH